MYGLKPVPFTLSIAAGCGAFHCPLVAGEGEQRKVLPVQVVGQVKNSREAGSSVQGLARRSRAVRLVPTAVWTLASQQPADAFGDRIGGVVARREKAEQCPGGLGWGARTHAAGVRVVVTAAGFAPSAVGILHHADPLRSLLDLRLMIVHADGFEAAQDQERAVD